MMNIYLITFFADGVERESQLVSHIKDYGIWARLTNTTWCIKVADTTTVAIRDNLNSKLPLQQNERLMVIQITDSSWASYNMPKSVVEWLKEDNK